MNKRRILSDGYDWDSTDGVSGEDKVRLYDSQEKVHLLNFFCGINYPFVNFEGKDIIYGSVK